MRHSLFYKMLDEKFIVRKITDVNFWPEEFIEKLKEGFTKYFFTSSYEKNYEGKTHYNYDNIRILPNFGNTDLISNYNFEIFKNNMIEGRGKIFQTIVTERLDGAKLGFYNYKGKSVAILHNYNKNFEGGRILAIFCSTQQSENVYNVFFGTYLKDIHNMTDDTIELSAEDNFRYGFDGDIDAWNHHNQ